MAEVTVSELAKTVGASVDRLLMQMKEAGLNHSAADATVSDDEKQTLLAYLKGLHGESSGEPKKITLRRKTVSTLKSGNRKTVNIEVRKKRTYIKRSDEELETQAAAEAEEKVRLELEAAAEAAAAQEQEVEQAPEEEAVTERSAGKSSGIDDIEERRLSAIQNRRKAESEAKAAAEDAAIAKHEEEARKAAEAASALERDEAKKAAKPTKLRQLQSLSTTKVVDMASQFHRMMKTSWARKPLRNPSAKAAKRKVACNLMMVSMTAAEKVACVPVLWP